MLILANDLSESFHNGNLLLELVAQRFEIFYVINFFHKLFWQPIPPDAPMPDKQHKTNDLKCDKQQGSMRSMGFIMSLKLCPLTMLRAVVV